jgi:hypothetical protein
MPDAPLLITGPEQSRFVPELADGGLPYAVGVHSYQVFRASKDTKPDGGRGWTYHHHVDLACWKGRLYVGWNTCEKDEDVWPSRELYSSSVDGIEWDEPRDLFPQGTSTPLRMYFFHASNGRMLAIAGLRVNTDKTSEDAKGGLVVREIRADHTLGEVFILQNPGGVPTDLPTFDKARDDAFHDACRELLADRVYLEQQDRGRLLGERAMKWHDAANWPGGVMPGGNKWVFGKAFSFYRRPDGVLVGVSKMGWTVTSSDGGASWTEPTAPPTLVTGKAKVWGQRTADGRYALVYNPSARQRWPLVVVTGSDGHTFGDMRVVQGELPIQRYEGDDRSVGPQYVRGVSHWADDGSRSNDGCMWLVYSMSKEDIWVSRVPVPVVAGESRDVHDDFTRPNDSPLSRWNVHCPLWCEAKQTAPGLLLEDRDPHDYAAVSRVLKPTKAGSLRVSLTPDQTDGRLEIDLVSSFGGRRPIRVALAEGVITLNDQRVAAYREREAVELAARFDTTAGKASLKVGQAVAVESAVAEGADDVARLSIRTGSHRNVGGKQPVPAGADVPVVPTRFVVHAVNVS